MISSSKLAVQVIVEECIKNGVTKVICSPGSRNAPLVIAFDEHPDVECILIHDERVAAFYALGMAQQLKKPVAVLCTSGSAALNYYPAVAEAYYQLIPLVVITADRPEEWINHGDGQTIVQRGVYKNHIRYELDLDGDNKNRDEVESYIPLIRKAFETGNGSWKGPIHVNIALDEPLYEVVELEEKQLVPYELQFEKFEWTPELIEQIMNLWSSEKKLILCGQSDKNDYLKHLLSLVADDMSVAVLVENTSNLTDQHFIHCIDRTLATINENELVDFAPEVLITIGGAIVSKKIKAYFRKNKAKVHWRIAPDFPEMDTYRSLTKQLNCSPNDFFAKLIELNLPKNLSDFGAKWRQRDWLAKGIMSDYLTTQAHSDLKVFELLLDYIPENSHLHMANSSVVRYCQLFNPVQSIHYWSNRGTSGIDGSTSTACGAALADKTKIHTLITGDISFFYDSNALWNNELPSNLRIFMINNEGGGIFKIIPGPNSRSQQEKYFVAKHSFTAEFICKAFGVAYFSARTIEEAEMQIHEFYEESPQPKLMEIFTDSSINHEILNDFFAELGTIKFS